MLVQAVGRRYFAAAAAAAAPSEEFLKRNYARNDPEYNTVIHSLFAQRRSFPLLFISFYFIFGLGF